MSDDFMSEISEAVDAAGDESAPIETVTSDVTDTDGFADVSSSTTAATEREILSLNNLDEKKEKAPAPKKEVAKEEEIPAEPVRQEEQQEAPKQPQQQPQRGRKQFAIDTYLNEDENKNLTLEDGTVIATAGKARTFFERVKREGREQRQAAADMAVQNMELGGKFKELYKAYNDLQAAPKTDLMTQTGLSQQDVDNSIQLMKDYKADPLSAIKKLLTRAHMSGINVSSLGVGTNLDPAAVKESLTSLVTDAMAKKEAPAQEPAKQMTAQEATQTVSAFFEKFPGATDYEQEIANAKTKFPDMSLDEIWLRMEAYLARQPEQAPKQPPAPRTPQPVRRKQVVQAPVKDFTAMSFDEIAKSIAEEMR